MRISVNAINDRDVLEIGRQGVVFEQVAGRGGAAHCMVRLIGNYRGLILESISVDFHRFHM